LFFFNTDQKKQMWFS